jgi:serine protease Do
MATEKNSDDNGKSAPKPIARCPNNFKPWIFALVVMVLFTLGWSVYEAQKRGGYFGRFFKERTWDNLDKRVDQSALSAVNVPGSARALQTSYHGIIENVRPAVISIDAVIQDQKANAGDPIANYARIGSGVIIDPRGYVLSSLHVVDGASSLKATVYSPAGALEYPIKIVKGDRSSDLVLLRIQGDGPFPHASLGDSNAIRTGDVVISIGSPFGFEQSVTSGIISSRNRTVNVGGVVYENLIQTDSSINKGSSGGPLISAKGDVVAINTAIYSSSGVFSGISFAVPINRSLELIGGVLDFTNEMPPVASGQLAAWRMNARQIGNAYRLSDGQVITPPHNYRGVCFDCHPQLRSQAYVHTPAPGANAGAGQNSRQAAGNLNPGTGNGRGLGLGPGRGIAPWCPVVGPQKLTLGITVLDVDDVIANQNNMMRPGGVMVNSVIPGTPADAGGLQRGDVIVRIDGRKIQDGNSFRKLLEGKNGADIYLVVLRSGARKTFKVILAQGAAAQAAAGTPIKQPTEFSWLGADISPLPPGKAGVYVAEAEGLMAAAGIKAGDIIKGVNSAPITDMNSFIGLTTKVDIKKGVLLDVVRFGDPLYITVKG